MDTAGPDTSGDLQQQRRAALHAVLASGEWMHRTSILAAMLRCVPIGDTALVALLSEAHQQGFVESRRLPRKGYWQWRWGGASKSGDQTSA